MPIHRHHLPILFVWSLQTALVFALDSYFWPFCIEKLTLKATKNGKWKWFQKKHSQITPICQINQPIGFFSSTLLCSQCVFIPHIRSTCIWTHKTVKRRNTLRTYQWPVTESTIEVAFCRTSKSVVHAQQYFEWGSQVVAYSHLWHKDGAASEILISWWNLVNFKILCFSLTDKRNDVKDWFR